MVLFFSVVAFAVAAIATISYKRSRASRTDGNQRLFLVSVVAAIFPVSSSLFLIAVGRMMAMIAVARHSGNFGSAGTDCVEFANIVRVHSSDQPRFGTCRCCGLAGSQTRHRMVFLNVTRIVVLQSPVPLVRSWSGCYIDLKGRKLATFRSHPKAVSSSIMIEKPAIRPSVAARCDPCRWVSGMIS